MSSEQHTYVLPPWLKPVNLTVGGIIMLLAGVMNVFTHEHLASRIPDWAGMTFLIPIGVWLYAALSALNWAVMPVGSAGRQRAVKSVRISAGLMEILNVGEHTWAYLDDHGKFGWGLVPLILLGSVPAFLDISAAHLVGSVLSGHHVPTEPKIPAEVSTALAEVSKTAEVSMTPPEPKIPIVVPAPNVPPDNEAKVPAPKPKPEASDDLPKVKPADVVGARRRALEEDRQWIRDLLKQGVPPETMTGKWLNEQNPDRRDPRSWLDHKNWVLKHPETEHAADSVSVSA
ncbi:hypothetical protein AB0G15_05260 [Streptosporangium sp. NPDC023825]|uniref:hypothetical protein n=1 Tax=Streptosporangium sp. NPDC023825 TaxID=3154909 RepID=UPI003445FD95